MTTSSYDEISKVGRDAYGVGFASFSRNRPKFVTFVPLNVNGVTQTLTRQSVLNGLKNATTFATSTASTDLCGSGNYCLVRPLLGYFNATGNSATDGNTQACTDFFNYVTSTAFQQSLLFNSAFFPMPANPSSTTPCIAIAGGSLATLTGYWK